jgi:hypothetical protein
MRSSISIALGSVALVLSAGGALARGGTTTTQLGLHAAPSANTELLLTMPAGAKVNVGSCAHGWCKVVWNSYAGYASQSGLAVSAAAPAARRHVNGAPAQGELVSIFPPYPYRAGHYPKADWYYQLPPYTAIEPSFYRRRYFMMAQERDRYRYMPHIFHGYSADGGPVESVDIQKISAELRRDLSTTHTTPTPTTPIPATPTPTPAIPAPTTPTTPLPQ